ncbi:transmembrane protein, putative, partial (macronuclear) [Tetrahymena thermophila SB210]
AKLTGYFINKSDILYLGSTLKISEKSQILSKIFTDHLQILSLFSFFSVNIPNYFKVPLLLSGNSLSLTSKSIDCFFSQFQNLKPLWFYQIIWSLLLPIFLFAFYLTLGLLLLLLKKNNIILKYRNTAFIFIYLYFFPTVVSLLSRSLNCIQIGDESYLDLDFNIKCFDPENHLPYMIYFSIPILFVWIIVIPLLIFLKIRNGKLKQWSIFTEIKYSIIFAGHKEKFYYWEFGKLAYKSIIIINSILFQQNLLYK